MVDRFHRYALSSEASRDKNLDLCEPSHGSAPDIAGQELLTRSQRSFPQQ